MDARPVAPKQTMAVSEDKTSVVVTTTQSVPKAQLQQQLAQLLKQAAQINSQISKLQETLALFDDNKS